MGRGARMRIWGLNEDIFEWFEWRLVGMGYTIALTGQLRLGNGDR